MKDILTCKQLANPLNEKNLFDAEYNSSTDVIFTATAEMYKARKQKLAQ